MEAALQELMESGYSGLSMDKVAARAGVSKASIYRRWASREDMILDAWRFMNPHGEKHLIDTGSLRGDLYAMVDEYCVAFGEELVALIPQMVAAVRQHPRLGELFEAFVEEQLDPMRAMYVRAQARGEVRAEVDVELAMKLVSGAMFYAILIEGRLLPPDDLRTSVDLVLDAILDPAYTPPS